MLLINTIYNQLEFIIEENPMIGVTYCFQRAA